MATIDSDLQRIFRRYEIVALGGSILVVGVVFNASGKSSLPELVNAIGIAFLLFGFIHLFVGIFGDPIGEFC